MFSADIKRLPVDFFFSMFLSLLLLEKLIRMVLDGDGREMICGEVNGKGRR
jgi:hypothetical protein